MTKPVPKSIMNELRAHTDGSLGELVELCNGKIGFERVRHKVGAAGGAVAGLLTTLMASPYAINGINDVIARTLTGLALGTAFGLYVVQHGRSEDANYRSKVQQVAQEYLRGN